MTLDDARAYLNYLLTLNLRREDAFGPLALTFLRDHDLSALGILAEEHFTLLLATIQAFPPEPKRYSLKLELLQKARQLLPGTRYADPELEHQIDYDIRKTSAEFQIYSDAMKSGPSPSLERQRLIIETDIPEYFLHIAQKRASSYFQSKHRLSKDAKIAQTFSAPPKRFEPDNLSVQKEFPGACAPFMSMRTNAFHLTLPFDLKISRKPDDPLDAGVRIFYAKMGYSFPLRYEMGKLCSYHDGQVYDIALNDPNLLFVSVSEVKDEEFPLRPTEESPDVPVKFAYPQAVLEHTGSLGPFIQVSCNFKIWFNANLVHILIQGAPDLYEYGLQGGSGLMTRSYASDKVETYASSQNEPWQDGLSFNFVNLHLQLLPGIDSGFIPHSTPIFSVFPVLNRQCYRFENRYSL